MILPAYYSVLQPLGSLGLLDNPPPCTLILNLFSLTPTFIVLKSSSTHSVHKNCGLPFLMKNFAFCNPLGHKSVISSLTDPTIVAFELLQNLLYPFLLLIDPLLNYSDFSIYCPHQIGPKILHKWSTLVTVHVSCPKVATGHTYYDSINLYF